jgi:predicted  nucleic acid-binding Zn-ribbon protein
MNDVLKAIGRTIEAYRTQVIDQEKRVARQRARVEGLEHVGNRSVVEQSLRLLEKMEEVLDQMQRDLRDTQVRYDARAEEGEKNTPT